MTLLVHIVAGGLGLVAGAVALAAVKGNLLHRKSGMVFVWAMLTMSVGGTVLAVARNAAPTMNIPAALIAAYLVSTALTTVRPGSAGIRRLDAGLMVMALAVGGVSVVLAFDALTSSSARVNGMAYPLLMFGGIGLAGGLSDLRLIQSGGPGQLRRQAQLTRHLWRMCVALFIATASFFLGQARVFPSAVRASGVLGLPVLLVLAVTGYWLWRVRGGRTPRTAVPAK